MAMLLYIFIGRYIMHSYVKTGVILGIFQVRIAGNLATPEIICMYFFIHTLMLL